MRWLFGCGPLLAVVWLAAACGGGASPSTNTASPHPTAIVAPAPPPSPEPARTLPADTDERIRQCLQGAGARSEEAVKALSSCRAFPGIATVLPFAGEGGQIPVVLTDVVFGEIDVALVAWYENGSWFVQSLDHVLSLDARLYPQKSSRNDQTSSARLVVGDKTRLGIIHSENAIGSGAHEGYLLLELIDGRWIVAWDSNRADIRELSHTKIEFEGPGVDTIHVRGASWYMKDAKSQIFHESNAGPHRWFEQTWVRRGNEYVMQSGRVVPSPYNTLVEFVYALGMHDDQTATSRVTDISLLDSARIVLHDNRLTGPWSTGCEEIPPCIITGGGDYWARVEMVPAGEDWLVSGIQPCKYWYDNAGGHCD